MQIVHAMKTAERRALVERLRERNAAVPPWTVNEDALASSLTVVDPFTGFVRRARRETLVRSPRPGGPIGAADAENAARAFVKKNADLLGLPSRVVPTLTEQVRSARPSDHASPRTAWVVHLETLFASKGYEAFKEIGDLADVEVLVDDDGEVSSFVNLSRIHPHLMLDTTPDLGPEDPRLVSKLVGRKVFAVDAEAGEETPDLASARLLRRIPLGEVQAGDVTHVQLVIHVATGPRLAWLTYRLGYLVEIAKPARVDGVDGGEPIETPGRPFFFFRYVVDADTGDVLEDARAPATSEHMP